MILLEIGLIILYLINSEFAFLFSFIFFAYLFFKNKNNLFQGLVRCMIYSSPLFSISLIGNNLHQIFSWAMIFLILYTVFLFFELILHRGKTNKILNISLILLFAFLIIRNSLGIYFMNDFQELFQIAIMIIPIYFTFLNREYLRLKISQEHTDTWLKDIKCTILATAIAVLFQYFSYRYYGSVFGNISLLNNRIIFDLFFKGYSVLSIFLSIGVVLYCDDFFEHYRIKDIMKMFVILVAIAINSSRAGLVAALIICAFIYLKHIKNKKTILLNLFLLIIGIIGMYFLIQQLTISRGDSSFLVSSGREDTYIYALNTIKENMNVFFFGGGLSSKNYTQVLPHNFLLQLLLNTGIFCTIISASILLGLIKFVKNNSYFLILSVIIIGGLFITDFHSNVFFTIFAICGVLTTEYLKYVKEGENV